jgi:hypothetical protein
MPGASDKGPATSQGPGLGVALAGRTGSLGSCPSALSSRGAEQGPASRGMSIKSWASCSLDPAGQTQAHTKQLTFWHSIATTHTSHPKLSCPQHTALWAPAPSPGRRHRLAPCFANPPDSPAPGARRSHGEQLPRLRRGGRHQETRHLRSRGVVQRCTSRRTRPWQTCRAARRFSAQVSACAV